MSPVGFEPTISARERPQTYALEQAATGIGITQPVVVTNYATACVIILKSAALSYFSAEARNHAENLVCLGIRMLGKHHYTTKHLYLRPIV